MQKLILALLCLSGNLSAQSSYDMEDRNSTYQVISSSFMGFGPTYPQGNRLARWDFRPNYRPYRMDTLGRVTTPPFTAPSTPFFDCVRSYHDQYHFQDGTTYWRGISVRAYVRPNGQTDVYTCTPTPTTLRVARDVQYNVFRGDSITNSYVMSNVSTGAVEYVTVKTNNRCSGFMNSPLEYSAVSLYMITTTYSSTAGGPALRTQVEAWWVKTSNGWPIVRSREDRDANGNVTYSVTDFYKKLTIVNNTTDGSPPWSFSTLYINGGDVKNVDWISASTALVCTDNTSNLQEAIMFTNNNGDGWNYYPSPSNMNAPTYVHGRSADTAYATVLNKVYQTTNRFQNWVQLPINANPAAYRAMLCVRSFLPNELMTIAEQLEVQLSDDGGATWRYVTGVPPMLGGEVLVPSTIEVEGNSVHIGSSLGRVFSTFDKGQTWTVRMLNRNYAIKAIAFKDLNNALAVNSNNEIYVTSNGGASWSTLPAITTPNLTVNLLDFGGLMYLNGAGGRQGFYMAQNQATGYGTYISYDDGQTWIRFNDNVLRTGASGFDITSILGFDAPRGSSRKTIYKFRNAGVPVPFIWKNDCQLSGIFNTQYFYLPTPVWYKDGQEIPNSAGTSYMVTQPGSYQMVFLDPFQGVNRLSDPIVVSVTGSGCDFVISGLEDPIAETTQVGIELFPNPTYGPATLRFHESWAGLQKSVMVYDLAGRLVASLQTSDDQTELNLDAVAGFYMVTVQAENGQRVSAALVKE